MSIYKRGPYWWAEFQVNGAQIRRSTGETQKRLAQIVEKQLKLDYRNSTTPENPLQQKTYSDALLRWLESGAPESMLSHARITRTFLDGVALKDVPRKASEMKTAMLKRKLSPQTINRRLAVVRRVLNLCFKEWEWLDLPLAQKIERMSEKGMSREIYLDLETVTAIFNNIENEEVKKIVLVAAYTGLRRGEILRLQPENWRNSQIVLSNKTKSGKPRTVPVISSIREYVTPPFQCTEWELRVGFETAREAIKRPDIRFHDLRHTFGSWLASNAEIPLTLIRDLMGHSSLAVTSKYAHLREGSVAMLEHALPTKVRTDASK